MSERPVRDERLAGYARQSSTLGGAPLIALPGRTRPLPWDGWTRRHVAVMVVLIPVLYLAFRSANPAPGRDMLPWILATLTLAGLGALVLATYVPRRRAGGTASVARASDAAPAVVASGLPTAAGSTPCAAMAGGSVLVAMIAMSSTGGPIGVIGALALMAFGLYQRTSGTCGV